MLLIFCVCILSLNFIQAKVEIPPELLEYAQILHTDCVAKSGITEEQHKSYTVDNKDPKMMCYMQCLMLDSKWMNSNGVIQYDYITANAHPQVKDALLSALSKCRDIADGTQECEKSYNFHICMHQADPENWFLA